MKSFAVLALTCAAVSTAACAPPNARRQHEPLQAVARLECPERQGDLGRTGAASDGQSCRYLSSDGSEVELRLVKVSRDDPDAALAGVETELRALLPQEPRDAGQASPASSSPSAAAAAAQAEADARADSAQAPSGDRDGGHDQVEINLPGLHIQADDDKAKVRIAGLNVDADNRSDKVRVTGGTGPFQPHGRFSVDADDRGAVIRARSVGRDVHATLIMASDAPGAQGWRAVGYQASGPRTGPLVVAVVRSKGDDQDRVFQDARRLASRAARG